MKPYEEAIAKNVLSLLIACPNDLVSTRKELLVGIRHILATEFRKGFYAILDSFLDENILIGPYNNKQNIEVLRPLALSAISDLILNAKDILTFPQLTKIIILFTKNLNDYYLNINIQLISVKLLINICEKFHAQYYSQVL
jgi:transformation/transcription domain-associated protein